MEMSAQFLHTESSTRLVNIEHHCCWQQSKQKVTEQHTTMSTAWHHDASMAAVKPASATDASGIVNLCRYMNFTYHCVSLLTRIPQGRQTTQYHNSP
jgi:hypothetical protein